VIHNISLRRQVDGSHSFNLGRVDRGRECAWLTARPDCRLGKDFLLVWIYRVAQCTQLTASQRFSQVDGTVPAVEQ
jgi:hypothetical protein